ncbi:hypothetical protein CEXT_360101 [Caerostris extrusa]|uniref:Uncharacterized protein n=1 Tax=Caerostris extrusa TaxID=172846 RepID=A0AAV4RK89_CAEEX|nr:hypothetical protein CEXT_360101 [Caerostris extrusa]
MDFNALPRKVLAKSRNHTSPEADHLMEMPKNKMRSLIPPPQNPSAQDSSDSNGSLGPPPARVLLKEPSLFKRTDSGSLDER